MYVIYLFNWFFIDGCQLDGLVLCTFSSTSEVSTLQRMGSWLATYLIGAGGGGRDIVKLLSL